MIKPATWNDDPECGHQVACAHQTHYCTYIRVPRLLTLQQADTPEELTLITAMQWYELWFSVLLADARAVLKDDCTAYEPIKLLKRGIALFELFDLLANIADSAIAPVIRRQQRIRTRSLAKVSSQLTDLEACARRLRRLVPQYLPALGDTRDEYLQRFKAFRARFVGLCRVALKPVQAGAPTYDRWLKLPQLLSLQTGVKAAWFEAGTQPTSLMEVMNVGPDENMFIVVHQCFEIWFKVMLDHIDRAIAGLMLGNVQTALTLLTRVMRLQKMLVRQIQIPATMLPLDFMRFREQRLVRDGKTYKTGLSPASGTESYQFREVEIVCGLKEDTIFQNYLQGKDSLPIRLITPRQRQRLGEPTLFDAFQAAVAARGVPSLDDLFTPADAPNPNGDLAQLADVLLEFDEFFRLWRLGHVSMVEKMIGAKSGTGFLGPEYLMETAGIKMQEHNRVFEERQFRPRFFEALWAVRTRMSSY